jgi:hypothetical protein
MLPWTPSSGYSCGCSTRMVYAARRHGGSLCTQHLAPKHVSTTSTTGLVAQRHPLKEDRPHHLVFQCLNTELLAAITGGTEYETVPVVQGSRWQVDSMQQVGVLVPSCHCVAPAMRCTATVFVAPAPGLPCFLTSGEPEQPYVTARHSITYTNPMGRVSLPTRHPEDLRRASVISVSS